VKNIMHILQVKYPKMGCRDDPSSNSYIIAKCWDLTRTPMVGTTLNNFKFLLFINNTDEMDPEQPYINLDQFVGIIWDKAEDGFEGYPDREENLWDS
jgi:hypothetical protein